MLVSSKHCKLINSIHIPMRGNGQGENWNASYLSTSYFKPAAVIVAAL